MTEKECDMEVVVSKLIKLRNEITPQILKLITPIGDNLNKANFKIPTLDLAKTIMLNKLGDYLDETGYLAMIIDGFLDKVHKLLNDKKEK